MGSVLSPDLPVLRLPAARSGRLRLVLEPYAAAVPGFFLYFRAQVSSALRAFVDVAREVAAQSGRKTG